MKIHRFIIEKINLMESANHSVCLSDKQLAHQMKTVLKLKPDEKIIIADGRGLEAEGQIIKYGHGEVEIHLNEAARNLSEPKKKIILYCSLLKRENFEFAAEKAAELGVNEITPVISEKTVKLGINPARLKRIVKEAAELAGRARIPAINQPVDFKKAIEGARANDLNLFFAPGAPELNFSGLAPAERIGVFVGPEGGWSEAEHYLAEANGLKTAGLGPLVLRAETAAIIAVFLAIKI